KRNAGGGWRVQGISRAVRLSRERERQRDADAAGLQRLRDELGRRGVQGGRNGTESGRSSVRTEPLLHPRRGRGVPMRFLLLSCIVAASIACHPGPIIDTSPKPS